MGNQSEDDNNDKHRDYEQLDSSSSTAISSGSLNSLSHSLNHRYLSSLSSSNNCHSDNNSFVHLNEFDDARYHVTNLKKQCLLLKEKRDKHTKTLNSKRSKQDKHAQNTELSNDGRSHYLFQKYLRSQLVNDDDNNLQTLCCHVDELLALYNGDCDAKQWNHLAIELKYFL